MNGETVESLNFFGFTIQSVPIKIHIHLNIILDFDSFLISSYVLILILMKGIKIFVRIYYYREFFSLKKDSYFNLKYKRKT